MVMPPAASFVFAPACEDDFERLLALRLLVMREHLERLDRYDPVRARRRFRDNFVAEHMRLILVDDDLAGCVALSPDETGLEILNFYIAPPHQSRGLGGAVVSAILEEADDAARRLHLQVLKLSPAIRFYQRHGFSSIHEDDWDIYMAREPHSRPARKGVTDVD
jgi:GNAT superfamily N-acetyltransferase